MKKQPRYIISGGGTGGHIYPALAIAEEIKRRNPEAYIHFVGAKGRMEMEKVPAAGYRISGLWISGIDRSLTLRNLSFPLKLISSLWKAFWILRKYKPVAVIGTGGFASGPTLFMAAKMGIPTLIQEQNSYPGITNRWLSSKVKKICVAYDGLSRWFPDDKIVFTGNPVRKDLNNSTHLREQARADYGIPADATCVLALGGSLGAKAINDFIEINIQWFVDQEVYLIWQTGKLYAEHCSEVVRHLNSQFVQAHAFLNEMPKTYALADIVISRAGAGTLSELCLAKKAAVLVPSPNVAEDHQTKNALALAENGAAILVKQEEMELRLLPVLNDLCSNQEKRKQLEQEISKKATDQADVKIVDQVESIIGTAS